PIAVDYPPEAGGELLPTADGRLVQQQPGRDNRKRTWIWRNLPADLAGIDDLWRLLLSLRSRYRLLSGAATPFVYLKDDLTGELRRRKVVTGTGSGTGSTLTDGAASWTASQFIGYTAEII